METLPLPEDVPPMPDDFDPDEPIEDLSAHYAHVHKLKIASP